MSKRKKAGKKPTKGGRYTPPEPREYRTPSTEEILNRAQALRESAVRAGHDPDVPIIADLTIDVSDAPESPGAIGVSRDAHIENVDIETASTGVDHQEGRLTSKRLTIRGRKGRKQK